MPTRQKIAALMIASALASGFAPIAQAEEPPHEQEPVCDVEQVLPGFGFLPITFNRFVYALLGGDPEDCQTPVE